MHLVKNKKVQKLRPTRYDVASVIRELQKNAHEISSLIIIEIPKKTSKSSHRFYHSRMKMNDLAWAMNVAKNKADYIINCPL